MSETNENGPSIDIDENGPSIVIYTDAGGTERAHPTTTLHEAVTLAESLYNDHSVAGARVFLLREIEIDLKMVDRVVLQPEAQQPEAQQVA